MDGFLEKEIKETLKNEFSYDLLMKCIYAMANEYSFLNFTYLTESVMGRGIPLLSLGSGEKQIFYVGAHHGAERITSAVLVRFLYEFCSYAKKGIPIEGMNLEYIMKTRTVYVLPMLNPDGVEISVGNISPDSLWYSRLLNMNGSSDFSLWQANANGVDLNHNYDAGFAEYKEIERSLGINAGCATRFSGEAPESEPESGALSAFLRFNNPTALITLHTQGREIYYTSGGICPKRSAAAAKYMSGISGYKTAVAKGAAAYGGLTDYCIQKLGIPAFTVECGKGKNPLPPSDLHGIYSDVRKMLYAFPTMF